jgi:hypothetical protein
LNKHKHFNGEFSNRMFGQKVLDLVPPIRLVKLDAFQPFPIYSKVCSIAVDVAKIRSGLKSIVNIKVKELPVKIACDGNCRRYLRAEDGLFCANFYSQRGNFAPCLGAWCPKCYVGTGHIEFPITRQLDEDGVDITAPGDETRFKIAQAGDHLMTPFQCELCHFHNIFKREPETYDLEEVETIEFLHRCCKDALWSRETSVVENNLRKAMRGRKSARFKFPGEMAIPPMGPYPLSDTFGMKATMVVLDRSLDPGKYVIFVQWDTFRKARSAVTNRAQAGISGLEDTMGAYEKKRVWISKVPTHTFWFCRFATGIHRRVGEIKKQDEAITINTLHASEKILEKRWRLATTAETKRDVGAWVFDGGFCKGLRGEEQVRIEFAGTKKSLKWLRKADPYFMFVVSGHLKGNQVSGAKFSVPCVKKTQGTGLKPGKWVERLIGLMEATGITTGRLFQRRLDPSRMFEMEDEFMPLMEEVQATSDAIDDELEIRERFGMERSLRRGVSTHARNMGVDEDLIKAINRWNKDPSKGAARLDMIELYSQADALTPLYLRYSRAL